MYVRPIPEEGQPELPREGFGYISRQVGVLEPPNYRECVYWDASEKDLYFDSMWRAGKAMSILACVIGGIVMGIVMCTCCVAFQLPTFEGLFWTCMFCFVAQALTFLAWGSDLCDEYECTWSSGTGMNITAAMLWIWAANMIKSFPEALPPRGRGRKKPVYNENDDDPYAAGGFDDEYDYDGEEGEFQNDGEYYDDYDDDRYDDPDQQYYDDDDDNYDNRNRRRGYDDQDQYDYQDDDADYEDYDDDNNNNNNNNNRYYNNDRDNYQDSYDTDYQDPDPRDDRRYKQGRDDEFEANSYFDSTSDDTSHFTTDEDTNAFHKSSDDLRRSQNDLSKEERNFLGDNDDNNSSFRDID